MSILDKIFKREAVTPIIIQYSHTGGKPTDCYSFNLVKQNEQTHVIVHFGDDLNMDKMIDYEAMDKVTELLESLNVTEWNGFNETSKGFKDIGYADESFTLMIKYSNLSTVNASGVNSFPKGFSKFDNGLKDIISSYIAEPSATSNESENDNEVTDATETAPTIADDVTPKSVEAASSVTINEANDASEAEDHLKSFRISFTYTLDHKTELELDRSDVNPNIAFMRIRFNARDFGFEPNFGYGDRIDKYSFYGKAPNAPFERLENAIKKYDVTAWDGYSNVDSSIPTYGPSYEYFRFTAEYTSGRKITADGNVAPTYYYSAKKEITDSFIDYLRENINELVPLN